jgi:dihydrofolate reductase
MTHPRINIIAAIGTHTRALGKDNTLLWRIPEDLSRFKELTMGHPVIMGSKTYESIGKPLPGRMNIVLSDIPSYAPDGVTVCTSLEEAIRLAQSNDTEDIFVIGGGQVYAQTIERADRLYLTLVDDDAPGDVYFPEYESLPFRERECVAHTHNNITFSFVTYERAR